MGTRPARGLIGPGEGDLVIVDGTLIPTDRLRADEPYYRNPRKHGTNVQVIAAPDGHTAVVLPRHSGRIHDLTAAHTHSIVHVCLTRQILMVADSA